MREDLTLGVCEVQMKLSPSLLSTVINPATEAAPGGFLATPTLAASYYLSSSNRLWLSSSTDQASHNITPDLIPHA